MVGKELYDKYVIFFLLKTASQEGEQLLRTKTTKSKCQNKNKNDIFIYIVLFSADL